MGICAGMRAAIAAQMDRCGIGAGMDRAMYIMHMIMVCFMNMGFTHVRFRGIVVDTLRQRRAGAHRSAIRRQSSARQEHADQNQSCCDSQSHLKTIRIQLYVLLCRHSKARALPPRLIIEIFSRLPGPCRAAPCGKGLRFTQDACFCQ